LVLLEVTIWAGMPHVAAFFSMNLITLASDSTNRTKSWHTSWGGARRAAAALMAAARFSASLRSGPNSAMQGGPCLGACPGNAPGMTPGESPGVWLGKVPAPWDGKPGFCPGACAGPTTICAIEPLTGPNTSTTASETTRTGLIAIPL
jgi:hypothetical protein